MDNSEHLTIHQIAAEQGVSRQRVWQLIHSYGINVVRLGARKVLVSREELKKLPSKKERQRLTGVSIAQREDG